MDQKNKKYLPHASAGLLAALAAFTQPFEGTVLKAYQHPGDVPTICTGHTGKDVHLGELASRPECLALLAADEAYALNVVQVSIEGRLTDGQKIAFADFIFNEGIGTWQHSSMLRDANSGHIGQACNDLLKYDIAAGRKLAGLDKRRQKERELCLKGE